METQGLRQMEANTKQTGDIKAEKEGERGFKAAKGAQSRPFLCSPPIELERWVSLGSHTRNVAYHPAAHLSSGTN
jgi:hypothetical protein